MKRTSLALLVGLLGLAGVLAWRLLSPTPVVAAGEPGAYGFAPGERVVDFAFRTVDDERGRLSELLADHEAVVVVLRGVDCPVSQKYGHELARLEQAYGQQGVAFLYLDIGPQDDEAGIRDDIATFGFAGPYVRDAEAEIGRLLQARVTTETFVIDRAFTLRYRGAVDDQYGITFAKPEARSHYLRDALDAVLAGRTVSLAETEASGCYLEFDAAAVPRRDITYHARVSRILQDNCVQCHRDGGVAPFSLATYDAASGYRGMIRWVLEEKRMPPWFANPEHGEWRNDRTLPERDRRDVLAWIDAGAPEGDAADAPLPRKWVEGWQLDEEPDAIVQIPEPQQVPAEGVVDYRYVYVKTDFPEDRWVTKVEPRPTATQVTHHIIVYLVEGPDDEGGMFFAGTAPGVPATVYPAGAGKRLPAGAWLKFELHYTPNGRAAEDRSRVGFVFADGKPERAVYTGAVATTEFEIPAGADNHEVVAEMTFENGGEIVSFLPHMHLRGKSYRYELDRPGAETEVLLDVPRYDFNWQLSYEPLEPIRVEPGTVLRGIAHYDNSADNPANPDPTIAVRYGEQSFEEMMFGFFDWIPTPRRKRADAPASVP